MEIDVGRVIGDKYRLVRLLGRGSMGEVWAAHHQTLDEKVALKLLTQTPPGEEAMESPEAASARFLFEAQLAARLSRKTRHIVRVTDHGEQDGLPYLVMELLEGETLEAVLLRKRLDLLEASNIVAQIARALGQAHAEGIAHRDLKPANVFLTHDEDGQLVAKLLDFGIARAIHAHKRPPGSFSTAQGTVFGTPSYMSPEQARGSRRLDHRCDLWALATIAYEAVTGDLPLDGNDSDELLKNLCMGNIVPVGKRDPQLPASLDPFFRRAFADNVTGRFQSSRELASAFAHAVGGPTSEASLPSALEVDASIETEVPGVPSRRRRALLAIGAAVAAIAVVGLAWHALARAPGPAPAATASAVPLPAPAPRPSLPTGTATGLPALPALSAVPTVAASSLPRASVAPTTARPSPAAPAATTAPVVVAPPAPTPTPAPATTATTKKDKSDVF
jgi:serine/threonine protein kinase